MTLFLDHVFVLTQPGAAVAEQLLDVGLEEGSSNTHPGQGTANRRFFFGGFTLELLFVNDVNEAQHGAGKDLNIMQRSTSHEASPFGLVVRVTDPATLPEFANWQYYPDYFNGKLCFHVGENSNVLEEPLCICMPPSLPKASLDDDENRNVQWQLTSVQISLPVLAPSPTLTCFEAVDGLSIVYGSAHHMQLIFNHSAQGQLRELSPALPLTISW